MSELRAAAGGDHGALREILCVAPELIYSSSKGGETAAHIAARAGAIATVELLLAAAPDLFYIKDRRGRTPAQVTRATHNRLVRLLVSSMRTVSDWVSSALSDSCCCEGGGSKRGELANGRPNMTRRIARSKSCSSSTGSTQP